MQLTAYLKQSGEDPEYRLQVRIMTRIWFWIQIQHGLLSHVTFDQNPFLLASSGVYTWGGCSINIMAQTDGQVIRRWIQYLITLYVRDYSPKYLDELLLTFAHEVGHILSIETHGPDRLKWAEYSLFPAYTDDLWKRDKEAWQIVFSEETRAWEYAKQLLSHHQYGNWEKFEQVRSISLASYQFTGEDHGKSW